MQEFTKKNKWVLDNATSENEIEIKAFREGEVPGTHVIKYTSDIDTLEIKHTAHNREGFAGGAVIIESAQITAGHTAGGRSRHQRRTHRSDRIVRSGRAGYGNRTVVNIFFVESGVGHTGYVQVTGQPGKVAGEWHV